MARGRRSSESFESRTRTFESASDTGSFTEANSSTRGYTYSSSFQPRGKGRSAKVEPMNAAPVRSPSREPLGSPAVTTGSAKGPEDSLRGQVPASPWTAPSWIWLLPALALVIPVVTLVTTVSMVYADDTYIGSLDYPYFSDTGRDKPGYYVFAVGLTVSGLLLGAVTACNAWRVRHLSGKVSAASKLAIASAVCGCLSAPFLALLAIADTVNYPTTHNLGAYAFFLFAVVSATLGTVASFKCGDGGLAKVKLVIVSFMWVFVIIYLPVGLGLTCEWKRLTIAKCESLGLGNEYCTDTVRLNDTETKLWDYSECAGVNTMRSVCQLLSVLSLLAYFGSHAFDFRRALRGQGDVVARGF